MSTIAATTGDFKDFYGSTMLPALTAIVDKRINRDPPYYSQIFNVKNSTKSIEQYSHVSGVGLFQAISEGGSVASDKPVQGFDKTFSHSRFGLAVPTTQDLVEDDKINLIGQMHTELADSEIETIELQAVSDFNNAFDATFAGPDGVALCSASHPLVKKGGVQSNLLTAAADLDVVSLQLMLTQTRTMKRSNGNLMRWRSAKLVIAPANEWMAIELTKSNLRPDTAENAVNALRFGKGGMPEPFMWPYLTDPDAWFLTAPPEDTGLVWFFRRRPYARSWFDDATECGMYARRYKSSHGFYTYTGVMGTPGA